MAKLGKNEDVRVEVLVKICGVLNCSIDDIMEIITKEGQKINKYTPSENQDAKSGKKGKKVGIAYELDNGEIIYVPEE